ncbi:MAG TPA: PucR family transcriptional regulator [Pseudonocardia sp.]|nr:PucR family transcriptional regulator [Pseudonocardia sp.]
MPITVRQVLDLPVVRAGEPEVLAGGAALDRPVRWVHVSELAAIGDLLNGGELLLTTGMALTSGAESSARYLRAVCGAGASGLVVELGASLASVDDALVEVAGRLGLPLVVLHREIRFVEVTEAVHQIIVGEQYQDLRFSHTVHEAFTALSLENATAADIVARAAALCGAPVVLEDLGHRVLAYGGAGTSGGSGPAAGGSGPSGTGSAGELLLGWERRSRLARESAGDSLAAGYDGPAGYGAGLAERWLTTPVGLPGHQWGRLVLPRPPGDERPLRMVLERAAQALELGRMVERDRESPRFQAQGGLLHDLAAGVVTDEHEALTRASAVGLRPGPGYAPVVVRGGTGGLDSSLAVHRRTQRLAERVGSAAEAVGLSSLTGLWGAREVATILCLPADPDRADELLTRFAVTLQDSRSSPAGDAGERVGVGRCGPSLAAAGRSLREAAHAAEVAATMRSTGTRPFYRTGELRIRGLLSLLATDSRLQAFIESELQRLLTHDARHADGLLELLRRYLEADGNKAALARRVHMSRPTLYHRLAMIERILDVDLTDAESRLSLHVALLAYEQRRGPAEPPPR